MASENDIGNATAIAAAASAIATMSSASSKDDASTTHNNPPLAVLTFVLTVEYNGYQYAGFQRQTATFTSQNHNSSKRSRKSSSTSSHPITVQHQIETALQQWTNLSIATLRVRGAGRTDKGVHASGQVVAFDVPVRLMKLNPDYHDNEEAEELSEQCIQHLQEAYHVLDRYLQLSDKNSYCCSTHAHCNNATRRTVVDQWQIRRSITTRLSCSDIVIRSVRMYTGCSTTRPFEPRRRIMSKTYVYRLRFRRLAHLHLNTNNDDQHEKQAIHPLCHAGPHLLRRIHDHNTVWLCPWPLDSALLRSACAAFVGRHDFVNFVHKDERKAAMNDEDVDEDIKETNLTRDDDIRDVVRDMEKRKQYPPPHEIDLFEFNVVESDEGEEEGENSMLPPIVNATFTLSAKGFHRSMVRNLIGFAVDVARGIRSLEDIPILLLKSGGGNSRTTANNVTFDDGKSNSLANYSGIVNSAPACGLCLAKVKYEHDDFL
ncbi:hypothetical protein ACHAW5_011130 [Stephanodiscus triporus]|uniref:tRNA pseudouridine synthase n=1 Tax=Stephanodiscus triporus TaxID=2934178 RepID=A0ABD3NQ35_9STRA